MPTSTTTPTPIDPTAPKRVTVDNQTVDAHSLSDQMAAADRADANKIAKKGRLGIRFSRILPGDAV